jgi:hypothetical protein
MGMEKRGFLGSKRGEMGKFWGERGSKKGEGFGFCKEK